MKVPNLMLFIGLIGFTTMLASCKKDKEDPKSPGGTTPPLTATITISSPAEGAMLDHGQELHIHATVTAGFEMHGYTLQIRRAADNEVVWTHHSHSHATSYTIHEHWTNNVDDHTNMILRVTAELDHSGTVSFKEVGFHCHPHEEEH